MKNIKDCLQLPDEEQQRLFETLQKNCHFKQSLLFLIRQLPDEEQQRLFEISQKIVISTVAVRYFQAIASHTFVLHLC